MSSFELTGTVGKVEKLTSAKGNPYMVFTIKDDNDKTFELSLFGDSLSKGKSMKAGDVLNVKGTLSSREFTDKNGKIRYGVEMRPAWLEAANRDAVAQTKAKASDTNDDPFSSIPF